MMMRNAVIDSMGVSIGGRNSTDLRYADDSALLAHDTASMNRTLHGVDTKGKKAGLHLNVNKTKVMHINCSEKAQSIKVNNIPTLSMYKKFKNLDICIKENTGLCKQDVKTSIVMAKQKP